ncbi:ABC transporter substrate-binding protein [Lederbergia galactosidilytica]|nr:extracellular solute-binding protein [Lederbergia galactosidilytica]
MQFKKILPTMLTVLLLLLLAACNGSAENASKEEGQSVNENNDGDENVESESADYYQTPEMDFDMGGRTIKVVSWWDMTIPEDNPDNIQKKENLDALMEKHNFDIEYVFIDYGEYEEKVVASLTAGEPIGDIVRLGKTYSIPVLVKQDLLWPIDEYTKNPNAFNQKVTNEFMQYEGKGYGFTEDQSNFVAGIMYNRTLMDQLGMQDPQDYVDDDSWNWDTFMKVAKEANRDTNNDGKLDVWGLAQGGLLEQALYSNEAELTKGNQQNLEDSKTKEALNFVSKLATEEIFRPNEGGDWTEPAQFFRQGNTLMYVGAFYEYGDIKTDMEDYDIGFLPFPKGPSATAYHTGEALFQALTIPKATENPEQLLYIWEKINDIESMYDYSLQATLESNLTNESDIENAVMASDGMVVLDHNTFPSLPYYELLDELNNGTSISTVIEKYKTPFQTAIDEIYGQ